MDFNWSDGSIDELLHRWYLLFPDSISFPLFFIWGIWKLRNHILFDGAIFNFQSSLQYILQILSGALKKRINYKSKSMYCPLITDNGPFGFFDGVEQCGRCRAGGLFVISNSDYYELSLGCGMGSNTRAELLALWCLLHFMCPFHLSNVQIYGDSSIIIGWAMESNVLKVASLDQWKRKIRLLMA